MIKFESVATELMKSVSFEVPAGVSCKLLTNSEEEKADLLNTLIGLNKPAHGRVLLFGQDIYEASRGEFETVFKKTGIVLHSGGLISNLKVWENILLPIQYHMNALPAGIEKKIENFFGELDIKGDAFIKLIEGLPGPLGPFERRFIGMIRAMVMEPELMVYESIFEGLRSDKFSTLVKLAGEFQQASTTRTSLYLTSDPRSLESVTTDLVIIKY